MLIVDAHEDIAYNALKYNRNYLTSALNIRAVESNSKTVQETGIACLGKQEWLSGKIGIIFATLFVPPFSHCDGNQEHMYYKNSDEAHYLAVQQLNYYHDLDQTDCFKIIFNQNDMQTVINSWHNKNIQPIIGLILSMEGADPVRTIDELEYWYDHGLRLIGPAWSGTRYCGGTGDPKGLTKPGENLLETMSDLNYILDVSHMSELSLEQSIDMYDGVVIASHSNPRYAAKLDTPERLLSNVQIHNIAQTNGVIGIVPYNKFLKTYWNKSDNRNNVTIQRVAEMIDYICQLTGSCNHVGIGSDFDGGFGAESIPLPMNTIADLKMIGEEIATLGYNVKEINQIMSQNWINVLNRVLPS